MTRALLIAGPTASGKSALALELARRFDAPILNADSMQVYRDLRVLTARPTPAEAGMAQHELFGFVDAAENFSVGRWLAAATAILASAKRVIFVGGSGLYFKALTQGLSPMPPVAEEIRAALRMRAQAMTSADLHAELKARDPQTASRLRSGDRQRVLRALEVIDASGRPWASFHGPRAAPLLAPGEWAGLFLAPDRAALNGAIDQRFEIMLAQGALAEVAALAARKLDPALPAMRAHGAPALMAHLAGALSLAAAAAQAKLETRQYAKRQFTWARHQMRDFTWVAPPEASERGAAVLSA